MNSAAVEVMKELPDLNIAYGVSDEYRFVKSKIFCPVFFFSTQLALKLELLYC